MKPFDKILADEHEIIYLALSSIEKGNELLLTYFNQHCYNLWAEDEKYRYHINTKFQYYLDGIGIWFALKFFINKKIKKFNASELNEKLFTVFTERQVPLVLIGGNFNETMIKNKPLNVVSYINGYEDAISIENVVQQISNSNSKLIILGLGVPLQEKLAVEIAFRIPNLQIICIGNFLEYYFGTKSRAPKLLRNSGLEWLFRLFTEPKRLWKRYLLGIPIFIFRVCKEYFLIKSGKKRYEKHY